MKIGKNINGSINNFWDFFEIPMNSALCDIKMAFILKFETIENSIKQGDGKYSQEDLTTCVTAYETLRNSYTRFLHSCEIGGENPGERPDWNSYFSEDGLADIDLSEEQNQKFLTWLFSKANELASKSDIFQEIINKLYTLFLDEMQKQEAKSQIKNKKTVNYK